MPKQDKPLDTESIRLPRGIDGRFISRKCPICKNGILQLEYDRWGNYWMCDGLLDPENVNKQLQPCLHNVEAI